MFLLLSCSCASIKCNIRSVQGLIICRIIVQFLVVAIRKKIYAVRKHLTCGLHFVSTQRCVKWKQPWSGKLRLTEVSILSTALQEVLMTPVIKYVHYGGRIAAPSGSPQHIHCMWCVSDFCEELLRAIAVLLGVLSVNTDGIKWFIFES